MRVYSGRSCRLPHISSEIPDRLWSSLENKVSQASLLSLVLSFCCLSWKMSRGMNKYFCRSSISNPVSDFCLASDSFILTQKQIRRITSTPLTRKQITHLLPLPDHGKVFFQFWYHLISSYVKINYCNICYGVSVIHFPLNSKMTIYHVSALSYWNRIVGSIRQKMPTSTVYARYRIAFMHLIIP